MKLCGEKQRVEGELDPAPAPRELLLEQRIEDVMPRIAFVAAEVDGPADPDRKIGVDLDEAVGIALVPIVAAPALAGDELEVKRSSAGSAICSSVRRAAFGDGGAHHRLQPLLGIVKRS